MSPLAIDSVGSRQHVEVAVDLSQPPMIRLLFDRAPVATPLVSGEGATASTSFEVSRVSLPSVREFESLHDLSSKVSECLALAGQVFGTHLITDEKRVVLDEIAGRAIERLTIVVRGLGRWEFREKRQAFDDALQNSVTLGTLEQLSVSVLRRGE